jgi:hypothetical protein
MSDSPVDYKKEYEKAESLNTVLLIVIIIFLVWKMCSKEKFSNGLDYGTDMTAPINDYDIVDKRPAMSHPNAADMTTKVGLAQREDRWMVSRFDNSKTDNSNGAGMSGDSVTTPGAIGAASVQTAPIAPVVMSMAAPDYVNSGPLYYRNDPRDLIGQANYSASRTPIGNTNEMQDLIDYGYSM